MFSASAVPGVERLLITCRDCGVDLSALTAALDDPWSQRHVFLVMVQDFQDPYTLNVRQLMKCCVSEIVPDGRIIPSARTTRSATERRFVPACPTLTSSRSFPTPARCCRSSPTPLTARRGCVDRRAGRAQVLLRGRVLERRRPLPARRELPSGRGRSHLPPGPGPRRRARRHRRRRGQRTRHGALQLTRETGCDVVGVELSPALVAEAGQAAKAAGLGSSRRFLQGDAEALPLPDASADGVLCECALCIFPDKERAVQEVARVLRPGARLALSDLTAVRERLPRELSSLEAWVACLGDARSVAETEALLGQAGLVVELAESQDQALVELLDRIEARLRVARSLVGDVAERGLAPSSPLSAAPSARRARLLHRLSPPALSVSWCARRQAEGAAPGHRYRAPHLLAVRERAGCSCRMVRRAGSSRPSTSSSA